MKIETQKRIENRGAATHERALHLSGQGPKPLPGFTLVELLVVIAIIGVLVAMLLPAVQAAREAARRVQCINNLKQLGLALHTYHDSFDTFPPGYDNEYFVPSPSVDGTFSRMSGTWMNVILPFVEEQSLYDFWKANVSKTVWITDPSNAAMQQVREAMIPIYACPSDINGQLLEATSSPGNWWSDTIVCNPNIKWRRTSYAGCNGVDTGPSTYFFAQDWNRKQPSVIEKRLAWRGIFVPQINSGPGSARSDRSTPMKLVKDGLSKTFAIGEFAVHEGGKHNPSWSAPLTNVGPLRTILRDAAIHNFYTAKAASGGFRVAGCWFSSMHPGGANFVMGDGSVRFVSQETNVDILTAAATIRNGDWSELP